MCWSDLLMASDLTDVAICVAGAGVVGLASALRLLQAGCTDVTVVADTWTPYTTSDGAGAVWECTRSGHSSLSRHTMCHYEGMLAGGTARAAGVALVHGQKWSCDAEDSIPPAWRHDVTDFHASTQESIAAAAVQLKLPVVSGYAFTSVIVDSSAYLVWLMEQIDAYGGHFIEACVPALAQLLSSYDVIVNAMGLHAGMLAPDTSLQPVRGQLVRIYAPHVTKFLMGPDTDRYGTYILPRPASGVVCIGGTFQSGRGDTTTDSIDVKGIVERCEDLAPGLLKPPSVLVDTWVGLRPYRSRDVACGARVTSTPEGRLAATVDNYGHGGCGHSLHWGSAIECTRTVISLLPAICAYKRLYPRRNNCGRIAGQVVDMSVRRESAVNAFARHMRGVEGVIVPAHARL